MKTASFLLLALAAVASAAVAEDIKGDPAKGAGKVAMCIGCHGIVGYQATFPEVYKVPMIAGQSSKYIVSALSAYQKGERKHPSMRGVAGPLSAQDMADLGAYYEQLGKVAGGAAAAAAAAPPPPALKDRMAVCVACHGPNFSAPIDAIYPRLAGQYADYLYAALKAYETDGNAQLGRGNALMRSQLVQDAGGKPKLTFTLAELKQVAAYLASLPGELSVVPQPRLR
jgi:cytochrome c553